MKVLKISECKMKHFKNETEALHRTTRVGIEL